MKKFFQRSAVLPALMAAAALAALLAGLTGCPNPANNDGDPPALTGTVSVSGTAQEGETLTANPTGDAAAGDYQWQQDAAGNGAFANISGANAAVYVPTGANVDNRIRVVITRDGYTGSVASDPTVAVVSADAEVDRTLALEKTGDTTATLTLGNGTWKAVDGTNYSKLLLVNLKELVTITLEPSKLAASIERTSDTALTITFSGAKWIGTATLKSPLDKSGAIFDLISGNTGELTPVSTAATGPFNVLPPVDGQITVSRQSDAVLGISISGGAWAADTGTNYSSLTIDDIKELVTFTPALPAGLLASFTKRQYDTTLLFTLYGAEWSGTAVLTAASVSPYMPEKSGAIWALTGIDGKFTAYTGVTDYFYVASQSTLALEKTGDRTASLTLAGGTWSTSSANYTSLTIEDLKPFVDLTGTTTGLTASFAVVFAYPSTTVMNVTFYGAWTGTAALKSTLPTSGTLRNLIEGVDSLAPVSTTPTAAFNVPTDGTIALTRTGDNMATLTLTTGTWAADTGANYSGLTITDLEALVDLTGKIPNLEARMELYYDNSLRITFAAPYAEPANQAWTGTAALKSTLPASGAIRNLVQGIPGTLTPADTTPTAAFNALPRAATPEAVIYYDEIALANLVPGNGTYIIGGLSRNINAAGLYLLGNVGIAQTMTVIRAGTAGVNSNSLPQYIDVPAQPAAPTGVYPGDYKLIGTTTAMEWRGQYESVWATCANGETIVTVTNQVYVRYKGSASSFYGTQAVVYVTKPDATPALTLNYANETLAGLSPPLGGSGIYYTVNGESLLVTVGMTTTPIKEEWFGTTVSIVKKSASQGLTDSLPQLLPIPARPAAAPTGLTVGAYVINGTKAGAGPTGMQYKPAVGGTWTDCDEGSTAVASGSYVVRFKPKSTIPYIFGSVPTAPLTVTGSVFSMADLNNSTAWVVEDNAVTGITTANHLGYNTSDKKLYYKKGSAAAVSIPLHSVNDAALIALLTNGGVGLDPDDTFTITAGKITAITNNDGADNLTSVSGLTDLFGSSISLTSNATAYTLTLPALIAALTINGSGPITTGAITGNVTINGGSLTAGAIAGTVTINSGFLSTGGGAITGDVIIKGGTLNTGAASGSLVVGNGTGPFTGTVTISSAADGITFATGALSTGNEINGIISGFNAFKITGGVISGGLVNFLSGDRTVRVRVSAASFDASGLGGLVNASTSSAARAEVTLAGANANLAGMRIQNNTTLIIAGDGATTGADGYFIFSGGGILKVEAGKSLTAGNNTVSFGTGTYRHINAASTSTVTIGPTYVNFGDYTNMGLELTGGAALTLPIGTYYGNGLLIAEPGSGSITYDGIAGIHTTAAGVSGTKLGNGAATAMTNLRTGIAALTDGANGVINNGSKVVFANTSAAATGVVLGTGSSFTAGATTGTYTLSVSGTALNIADSAYRGGGAVSSDQKIAFTPTLAVDELRYTLPQFHVLADITH
jgi:hypothetical protein